MAIPYTAKGTATAKTSGTTLTKADVAIADNKTLVVCVGFDQAQGAPTCKWGGQTLTKVVQRLDATSGVGTAVFIKEQVWTGRASDIVIVWASAIGARAMTCFETDDFEIEDVEKRNVQAATTTPNTLASATTAFANEAVFGCFVSNGPVEDTAGTGDSGATPPTTLGQRAGTTGGALDITIQEAYGELTSLSTAQVRMTGVTSRAYVSILGTFRGHTQLSQGISPADVQLGEIKFNAGALDFENAYWQFNEALDRWEIMDTTNIGVVVAHSNNTWA